MCPYISDNPNYSTVFTIRWLILCCPYITYCDTPVLGKVYMYTFSRKYSVCKTLYVRYMYVLHVRLHFYANIALC